MDPKFKTSFIPKQEVELGRGRSFAESRFSLFSIIGASLFAVSIILAIGVFIYHRSLVNNINSMNAQLVAAKASFEPGFIQELVKTDKRIESAKKIIGKHNVVTPMFTMLEEETLQGVRFISLNYLLDSKGQSNLELKGEAVDFSAIALQSDVFNSESKIKNPSFNSVNPDDKGLVRFNFKGTLDPAAFLYDTLVNDADETEGDQATEALSDDSDFDVMIQDLPDIPN